VIDHFEPLHESQFHDTQYPGPEGSGKAMILARLFRSRPSPARLLYEAIVAAARQPAPYANWGVADTLDGRFDMITLHAFLVLDRLKGEDAKFRQRLVDEFFADMDRSLREMGVGDLSVGKKVRRMAEAFYGRIAAYDKSVERAGGEFERALERNLFPDGAPAGAVARLATYAHETRMMLAAQDPAAIMAGTISFPELRA
jgi:cytochrome b pre-mRNA-processing protein 3